MAFLGVTFGDYHTYKDLGLLMTEKVIGSPEPKTETVDIPGMNGTLDLSEINGGITYDNRTLKFSFKIYNPKQYLRMYSTVLREIHGKMLDVVVDDDNSWIYRGRVDVGDFTHNKKKDTFSISCDCQPFKRALTATDEPWKWDPFCFIDGVIIDYRYIPVPAGITEINLYQSDQPVAPTFLCTQDAVLTASGDIYTLPANVLTQFDDILVGENGLTVSVQTEQDGYITIGYKRRIL